MLLINSDNSRPPVPILKNINNKFHSDYNSTTCRSKQASTFFNSPKNPSYGSPSIGSQKPFLNGIQPKKITVKRKIYSFSSAQQQALVNQQRQLNMLERKYLIRFDKLHSPLNSIQTSGNQVQSIYQNLPARLSELSVAANKRKISTIMEVNLRSTDRLQQAQSSRPSSFIPQSIPSNDNQKMKFNYQTITNDSKMLQSMMLLENRQVKRPCDKTLRSSKLQQRQEPSTIDQKYKSNSSYSDELTSRSLKTKVNQQTKNIQVFQNLRIKPRPGPENPGRGNFFFRKESEDIQSYPSPKSETKYSPEPATLSKISLQLLKKPVQFVQKPQTATKKHQPVNTWSNPRMMINKLNLYEDRTPRIMIKSQTGVSYTHHATPNYHTSREFMKTVRTTLNYL